MAAGQEPHQEPQEDRVERITDLLAWGNDVDIVELDKSGHVVQRWLHAHDGHVLPVSISRLPKLITCLTFPAAPAQEQIQHLLLPLGPRMAQGPLRLVPPRRIPALRLQGLPVVPVL